MKTVNADKISTAFQAAVDFIAPNNIEETSSWLPKKVAKSNHIIRQDADGYSYDNRWPLAIYSKKTNQRITAQQGTFTIHGRHANSLDALITQAGG